MRALHISLNPRDQGHFSAPSLPASLECSVQQRTVCSTPGLVPTARGVRAGRYRPSHVVSRDGDEVVDSKGDEGEDDEEDDDDYGDDVVLFHFSGFGSKP